MKQPNPRRQARRADPSIRPSEARPMIEGTVGIWINKRSVSFLDLPFRHRLVGETAGWRLDVMEEGKLVVHGLEGKRGIDVEYGDFLLSAGDDIYVGLHREEPEEDREEPGGREDKDKGRAARSEGE